MIKKAKKIGSEKGLFAEPNKKLGKKISEDMVKCILVFFSISIFKHHRYHKIGFQNFASYAQNGV